MQRAQISKFWRAILVWVIKMFNTTADTIGLFWNKNNLEFFKSLALE